MKIKNKGKVHPSPSSSSSSSSATTAAFVLDGERDVFSVLKLLPAAILTLASVLSLDDREVLAYMIARSIKTTTNPSSFLHDSKKKPARKQQSNNNNNNSHNNGGHKVAGVVFDCDCFDCYTSYWFRWDSSPNRELIHQAIEAFEDHLTNGERSRKNTRGGKRTARRLRQKQVAELETPPPETDEPLVVDASLSVSASHDDDVFSVSTRDSAVDGEVNEAAEVSEEAAAEISEETAVDIVAAEQVVEMEERSLVGRSPVLVCSSHKGLARKVLPDVMGLLNSRLWSFWGPSM